MRSMPPRRHTSRRHLAARRATVCAAALLLAAGCGGGVFLGFEFGDVDGDGNPSVSLAVTPTTAAPGATVQLAAAASDVSGIESVQFFRLDSNGEVLLGTDGVAPFQWVATIPSDAVDSVRFFARARDGVGQRGDSNVVTVGVGR